MKIRKALIAVLLCLTLPAAAEIVTLIDAVETSTANLTLPTASNGHMSFKPCAEGCDGSIRVRLTAKTSYVLNGESMDFTDFRREFYKLRRRIKDYALVSYDTRKNTVTSLRVGE